MPKLPSLRGLLRGLCLIPLVFAVTAVASAQSAPPSSHIENVAQAEPGQVLVIGSIRYMKNGGPSDCGELLQTCHLIIVPPDVDSVMAYSFKSSGEFAWSLTPGSYSIVALDRGENGMGVGLSFTVPADAASVYIGDIILHIVEGRLGVLVEDRHDAAAQRLATKFRTSSESMVTSLVGDEENLGSWSEARHLCTGSWGLPCDWKKQGVAPLLPTKSHGPTFRIKDLQPQLQWKPSSLEGVTYDLALYEAVFFRGLPYRSHLVAYRQDLRETSWRPDQPLLPGRSYFWSVRARLGDKVSSWSGHTASYSAGFLGMQIAVAYQEWFRFDTPAK